MKAKRLIEITMPIKEISAESVRDKSIRHGHISTLHLWWARRPLPVSRAVVFASLVPDPLDENCPTSFKEAVYQLLVKDPWNALLYSPYKRIPYTAALNSFEDNLRNRLISFIGKFSDTAQRDIIEGKKPSPKTQLSDGSLVKWENKNNEKVLRIARELIWVAYNSEKDLSVSFDSLHMEFNKNYDRIKEKEDALYTIVDRHIHNDRVIKAEDELHEAISHFQSMMPMTFDPFSGGGAIPLEAARLGCRSYGNDINPVAHIIERCSAEFPQRFGKPLLISSRQLKEVYGEIGKQLVIKHEIPFINDVYNIPNKLSFDVEYYANVLLEKAQQEVGYLYPKCSSGNIPAAYIWARTATCSNPSCGAKIPLLRGFYVANSTSNKIYLNPVVHDKQIGFEIKRGTYSIPEWNHRGNMTCPCCGNITSVEDVKKESNKSGLKPVLLAIIEDSENGKVYRVPTDKERQQIDIQFENIERNPAQMPIGNKRNFNTPGWGISTWEELFSDRQLVVLKTLVKHLDGIKRELDDSDYSRAVVSYLACLIDKLTDYYNSFCTWHLTGEKIGHLFSRQAVPMVFDYAEANIFSESSGSFRNMLEWVLRYIDSESVSPFSCTFNNASSGEKTQFHHKELSAVVTDPPYYDAIGYADCSDFFYHWLKQTVGDLYPITFSTPQTPKLEECTALEHYHESIEAAKKHFEDKLTQIFDAIEYQTSDIVSIMFAHQSTEAWTTLCNSILRAKMNITASWPIDTELANRSIALSGAALESSVTVSCRPSERKGFGDYKEVKHAISKKVSEEVELLYALGFRGADLLTACFGQAVSEFGKYSLVEKADGSEVKVAELLEMARNSAFNSLLKGVQGDDFTRFYIGWLQMNGMGETDFDDATKFTRVGMPVDVSEIFARRLLIREGKKQHLATAAEHLGNSTTQGTHPEDSLIDQVHRAMLAYEKGDRHILLTLLYNVGADDQSAPFWRLVASLKELLPDGKDLKAVEGLLGNSDNLRQESREVDQHKPEQMTFDFGSDFNNDFK